jgi:hypothetical protein
MIPDKETLRQTPTSELEAMRSVLLRQLGRIGPVMDGTIVNNVHGPRKKDGTKARQTRLQRCRDSKLNVIHVPRDLEETVFEWRAEYDRAQSLLRQIADVNEQIIRNYVDDKRAARKAEAQQAQLRLVDEDQQQ